MDPEMWTFVAFAVPTLLALACGAMQMNREHPKDFVVARVCFWLSGLIPAFAAYWWLCHQSLTLVVHACAALVLVLAIGGVTGALLKWVNEREKQREESAPHGSSTMRAIAESAHGRQQLSALSHLLDEKIEAGRVPLANLEKKVKESEERREHDAWEKDQEAKGIMVHLPRAEEVAVMRTPSQTEFDVNNAFDIEALAVPDLQSRTERGLDMHGKPAWSLDCDISIHNRHPTQGFDDVRLRVIGITPPMVASPKHHPRTQDSVLRKVRYDFSDIPLGKALLGGQTGHVRVLNATRRKMDSKETAEVCVRFYGTWPDNSWKEFVPQAVHLLTVEVTGNGVARKEVSFKLSFSVDMDAPVFTVTKLSDVPDLALRKRRALYEAAATCLAKAPPIQFAGLKCLQDAGADAANLESNDDLVWVCDNLVRDGYEHPFYYFDEHIPQSHWLIFLTEARKSGINFGDDMATLMWFMETHPNATPPS